MCLHRAEVSAECPVLVGLSLGGNIAQCLVRREPHVYRALVVLDATWNTGPLTLIERISRKLAGPLLRLTPAQSLPRMMANASAVTEVARAETSGKRCLDGSVGGIAEVVVPRAGHVATLDAPEPVNAQLIAFLRCLT